MPRRRCARLIVRVGACGSRPPTVAGVLEPIPAALVEAARPEARRWTDDLPPVRDLRLVRVAAVCPACAAALVALALA